MGALQAVETLKLILGAGEPLIGKLLVFDALAMEWTKVSFRKDPCCPVCGSKPAIKELIDYEPPCGRGAPEISVEELKARLDSREDVLLLDVREPGEYEIARIPGAVLIPLGQLSRRLGEIEKYRARPILVHCKSGTRSCDAVGILLANGFASAFSVAGGIDAWSERVDRSVPRY